jgi:hypothetical protein
MLITSKILASSYSLLVASLFCFVELPVAHGGVANLSRVSKSLTKVVVCKVLKDTSQKLPYSTSHNERYESPEAIINWNRDCSADLGMVSLFFAGVDNSVRESSLPSQKLILDRKTLFAAHVLLRI